MEILPNYELRRYGDKLALRCLQKNPNGLEMVTVLLADEYVREHTINDDLVFILRQENHLVLCWENEGQLQTKVCDDYAVLGNTMIFQPVGEKLWYKWNSSSSPMVLGSMIGSFNRLFIYPMKKGYKLWLFEKGEWHLKTCLDCTPLVEAIIPNRSTPVETFSNVLEIRTEKGVFVLDIRKVQHEVWAMGKASRADYFSFTFRER